MNDQPELPREAAIATRAAPRIVKLAALAALIALAAVPFPILLAPAIVIFGALVALTIVDWRTSLRDRAPSLVRILPERMVKGRRVSILYRIMRVGAPVTLSILDELPADLGGDLMIEPMAVADGERVDVSREIVPRRRGIRALGPVYLL
ncbi:MAG: hypothetical protein WA854_06525, partial [Candidatus Binataceae bacterium]